jgi:hypothetical protein
MDKRLIIGWLLNAVWLLHLIFKNRYGLMGKSIAILLLGVPYLGFIFYFIFFVWDVPPPQPPSMRQNVPNHYGKTEYGSTHESERALYEGRGARLLVQKKLWARGGVLLFGLIIILFGLMSTLGIGGSYVNWWGGTVFGPAAVVIGILFIYVLTKAPRRKE